MTYTAIARFVLEPQLDPITATGPTKEAALAALEAALAADLAKNAPELDPVEARAMWLVEVVLDA